MGYQHSYAYELPNPATSSRRIIPRVPDFSQMSDPSVIIQPPNAYDQGTNNTSQTRLSRKEESKTSLSSKKQRRHRASSSSSRSLLQVPIDAIRNPRGRDIHTKREEDVRRRLLHLPALRNQNMNLVDIKGLIFLHILQRLQLRCNLWKQ